jgi:hypothetical protein
MLKEKIILWVILMLFIKNLDAQSYYVPFITIDMDGYTNIREQPNTTSRIIGKVYRYQIFYFMGEDCDDDLSNYSTDNWLYIHTDQVSGYIYKKKIFSLYNLSMLRTAKSIKHIDDKRVLRIDDSGKIVCTNDTLVITMQVQPFNKTKHKLHLRNDEDGEHVLKIDNQDFYGTNYRMPISEIESIEISCNGKKTLIEQNRIKNLYNPHTMSAGLGQNGELYLFIEGGGDAGQYGVWMSIIGGKILYECFDINCW